MTDTIYKIDIRRLSYLRKECENGDKELVRDFIQTCSGVLVTGGRDVETWRQAAKDDRAAQSNVSQRLTDVGLISKSVTTSTKTYVYTVPRSDGELKWRILAREFEKKAGSGIHVEIIKKLTKIPTYDAERNNTLRKRYHTELKTCWQQEIRTGTTIYHWNSPSVHITIVI